MMQESESLTVPAGNAFQAKLQPQMNSQGELITPTQETQSSELPQSTYNFDDVVSLGDTDLAIQLDSLCPPTDDTGMVHEIISCGHVLKSTHDLARWSEKTGARRVNGIEALDAVSDLAVNLEPNRSGGRAASNEPSDDISGLFNEGGKGRRRRGKGAQQQQWRPVEGEAPKSEVIACWPVLKSTHDQAQLSEKRGRYAVNQAGSSGTLEELAINQGVQGGQQRGRGRQQQGGNKQRSAILNSWPVMKSTHDLATPAEKWTVNKSTAALEEVVQNQGTQAGGSSLQSGLDTQAGSHVQLDSTQKLTETPEKVMESLHVHV